MDAVEQVAAVGGHVERAEFHGHDPVDLGDAFELDHGPLGDCRRPPMAAIERLNEASVGALLAVAHYTKS